LDGTTDITRTFHFGEPTAEEKDAYTRVLKGFIALSRAVFPKGGNGYYLDVLARQFLWQAGLDYNHGTGTSPAQNDSAAPFTNEFVPKVTVLDIS